LELLDSRPGWGGGKLSSSSILLNPLNAEATAELIRFHGEVMPHGTDAEETVVGIVERSGGNPLFVEQLVAAVRGGHEIGTLPLTVQTVIAARVDALGPDERTTLQYAAVIGREFDAEVLHELCAPAQVATLERTLAQLTRKQFVEPRGTAYQFRNAQIQEVARDALPKRVRAGIHLRIADLLAARGGFATERDACAHLEQAVRHFEELGMAERAAAQRPRLAAALSRITEQALRGGRLQDAVDPLQRTLAALTPDDPERWRVQLTLGTALVAAGSFDEAGQALRSVAQEADRRGDRVLRTHATLELGRLPGVSENPEEVLAQAREAMAVFDAAGDQAGQAKAWLRMGHAHQAARRYGQAAPAFEHSLTDAEQSGDPLDLATIMGGLAMSLWLGPVPAPQAIDRCADLLRHIPEGKELARMAVSCPLAMLLAMRGDLGEATALLDEAEQLAAELAHKHVMISVAVFAAEVRGLAGDEQGALRRLSVAHHALSKIGAPMLDTIIANQVRIHLDAGRIDRAAELIGGLGEGEARGADTADHPASWHGARARFALAVGRLDVAERSVAAAVEAAFRSDSLASQALALLDHAHYLQRAGDPEAARGAAGRAGALCRRKGDLAGAAKVRAFLADLSETDLSETGLSETGES
jgi:tetratricopeptide (TPR) repeat protein